MLLNCRHSSGRLAPSHQGHLRKEKGRESQYWISSFQHGKHTQLSFSQTWDCCDYLASGIFLRRLLTCWEPVSGVVNSSSSSKQPFSSVHAFSCIICLGFVEMGLLRAFMPDNINSQPQTLLAVVMHWLGCGKSERREKFNTRNLLRNKIS